MLGLKWDRPQSLGQSRGQRRAERGQLGMQFLALNPTECLTDSVRKKTTDNMVAKQSSNTYNMILRGQAAVCNELYIPG